MYGLMVWTSIKKYLITIYTVNKLLKENTMATLEITISLDRNI